MILKIKVIPNSHTTEFEKTLNEVLKIKIAAPKEKNKANLELIRFLSSKLDVPRRNIEILRGLKSKTKLVQIQGLNKLPDNFSV